LLCGPPRTSVPTAQSVPWSEFLAVKDNLNSLINQNLKRTLLRKSALCLNILIKENFLVCAVEDVVSVCDEFE